MSRPTFPRLHAHYPSAVSREALFADIGWNDLVGNQSFMDTCAIRMSYALLHAGVTLPGARMAAKGGKIKGWDIEPGQARLSKILKRIWGAPEVYAGEDAARAGIGKRKGVVSFFRIQGGSGGHIDLVWTEAGHMFQDCARSCYFSALTVWFWPLK